MSFDRLLRPVAVLSLSIAAGQVFAADLVINEVDYDINGTDTAEFYEIKNVSGGPIDLDDYRVELVNGSGGAIYVTTALPAISLPAGGYFVVCGNAANTINCDLDITPNQDLIQNGAPDAMRIVRIIDSAIEDALSYEGDVPGSVEGTGVPGASADSNTIAFIGLSRFPDGSDTNNNSADFSLRCITPGSANVMASAGCTAPVAPPAISIDNVLLPEGDGGDTTFTFTVTLSNGDLSGTDFTVDVAVVGISATGGGGDFTYSGPAQLTFDNALATETQQIQVTVHGDVATEPDETFEVQLSNATGGVTIDDAVGLGTIDNDDVPTPTISQVQGNGATSPFEGVDVAVEGIVTAVRPDSGTTRGFWIQRADPGDSDPATSDGLFVFCGDNYANCGTTVAALALGVEVRVTGTVIEYIPAADPRQLPLTQISNNPTVTVLNAVPAPLPAPIEISLIAGNAPTAGGGLGQLEQYEGMRVTVPSLSVTNPTESDVFFATVTGAATRPFRDAGIDTHDHAFFQALAVNVPEWDANPENLRVKTRHLLGNTSGDFVNTNVGEEWVNATGVLDYAFRHYTLLTYPGAQPTLAGGTPTGDAVAPRNTREFTVGSFNIENLGSSGSLPARLDKIKQIVRDYLHDPDILGLVEISDQATVNALTTAINGYNPVGSSPVNYVGEMVTPSGTQNLAIIYNTALLPNGAPRVQSLAPAAEFGEALELLCPDGITPVAGDLLNDRPPLVKNLRVTALNGQDFDLTVVVNHLKSLIGVDSTAPYPAAPCFADEGTRNRAKRQQQAEFLAGLIDTLEGVGDTEPVVLVGDFNAFPFNDGFTDMISVLSGITFADDVTVQPDDGNLNLLDPDLFNVSETAPAASAYSYVFDGTAQILDQVLVNQAMIDATIAAPTNPRVEFAHVNADFCDFCTTSTDPFRGSDHDPVLAFVGIDGFGSLPTISDVADQTTNEGTATGAIPFTIADAEDGSAITCADVSGTSSVDSLVPDANVVIGGAAQTCNVTLTPVGGQTGTTTITLEVTDSDGDSASDSFDLVVNALPQFTSTAVTVATEDQAYNYAITTSDADVGDTRTITAPVKPTWLSFADNGDGSATLTGTPTNDDVGDHSVTLTVDDGDAQVDQSFTVTVSNTNDAPQFSSTAVTTATEDQAYNYAITTSDVDVGDTRTIALTTGPTWLGVTDNGDGTATLAGTPTNDDVGDHNVTLTVDDGDAQVDQSFTITVTNVNDDPTLANAIPNQSASEDVAFSFQFAANTFADADNDVLTYSAQLVGGGALPAWLSFDANTRTFSGTPSMSDVGTVSVRVTADDGNGGTPATEDFDIVVSDTNDDPTLANAIPNQSASEDVAFSFQFAANTFADADNDVLTYSAQLVGGGALPAWLSFDANTRTFSGTPTMADVGTVSIRVTADDGNGGTPATDDFDIVVGGTNDAPTISDIADQSTNEDTGIVVNFTLDDVDSALTCSSTHLSATSSNPAVVPTTSIAFGGVAPFCILLISPAPEQSGSTQIQVTVSDGSASASDSFVLTVNPVNDAPVITNPAATTTATEDVRYDYDFDRNDVDGPGQTWSLLPTHTCGGSVAGEGLTSFTISGPTPPASCVLAVQVCDGGTPDLCDSVTVTIDITAVNDAPVVNDQSFTTLESATLGTSVGSIVSSDPEGDTVNFSVTGGTGDGLFDVDANGNITVAAALTEGSYTLEVTGTDDGTAPASDTATITIVVNPLSIFSDGFEEPN